MGGLWIYDKETGENNKVSYEELDAEQWPKLLRPVGGFCYDVEDFKRLELSSVPYYMKGWLPQQGKALLYAPAKSGKSFLSQQLARCVGCGEPFLGVPTTTGKVLYTQYELGEEVLQRRLRSTRKSYDNVYVGTTFSLKLDDKHGQDTFERALCAIQPNLVIIDPLYKALRGDENEAHDLMLVLDFLDSMIDTYKCSFFIIHHTGKDPSRGGRGSSVLEGWVDASLEMKRTSPKGERLKVKITPKLLRHAELPPDSIEAELGDNMEFELVGHRETITSKVEAYLREHQAASPAAMVREGIGARKSIYNALESLMEQGIVAQAERGIYEYSGRNERPPEQASL